MELRILGLAGSVALLAALSGSDAAAQQSLKYAAQMNGATETPPNTEKATGTATMTLANNQLRYTITVKSLSGPATSAHIHVGKVGVSGPPVYTFTINSTSSGTLAEGSVDLTKDVSKGVSGDSLRVLLNTGNAYVNVHTSAHVAGEIRGQVKKP